jgi:hypothetical protein
MIIQMGPSMTNLDSPQETLCMSTKLVKDFHQLFEEPSVKGPMAGTPLYPNWEQGIAYSD